MSNVAQLVFDNSRGKYKAMFDGVMLCQSTNKFRVIQLIETGECQKAASFKVKTIVDNSRTEIKTHGAVSEAVEAVLPKRREFGINERFDILANLTDLLIAGQIRSVIVTGEGGLGKTYTVSERLKAAGLVNADTFIKDDENNLDDEIIDSTGMGDYIFIKGHSSAKGLYRKLFEYRASGKIIVFDDCDGVLTDKTSLDILKSALDSSDTRVIAWNAEAPVGGDGLPRRFEFKASVIFISNRNMHTINQAIKSRSSRVDLSMTAPEKIARMNHLLPAILPSYDMKIKRDSLDFITSKMELCTDLNIRTLLNVCIIRANAKSVSDWRALAEYSMTA